MVATWTDSHSPAPSVDAAEQMTGPPLEQPMAFGDRRVLPRSELLAAPLRWPRPSRLDEQLALPRGKLADGMSALGVSTVGELLEHLPRDSRESRTIAALRAGEQATVAVQIRAIGSRPVRRRGMRPLVEATVFDATGTMRATFFNQPWLVQRYPPGTSVLLHGKADARGGFRVSHPAADAQLPLASSANDDDAAAGAAGDASPPAARGSVAHYPASEGARWPTIPPPRRGVW